MRLRTLPRQRVKLYAAMEAMATWNTTMGTTRMTLFQNFTRYSGERISPVTYWLIVTLSGMNFKFTVLDT